MITLVQFLTTFQIAVVWAGVLSTVYTDQTTGHRVWLSETRQKGI